MIIIEQNTIDIMKEHQTLIETARAEIQNLQETQNEIYQCLIDELDIECQKESWLWDYCFNCSIQSPSDEYTQSVRNEIYGSEE